MEHAYVYKARVSRIIDGDTIDFDVSLGFGCWLKKQRFRLYNINAPEVKGAERQQGLVSKEFLVAWAAGCGEVLVETFKDRKESFGRWLANVWYQEDGNWKSLCDVLIAKGLAVYKEY